MAFNIEGCCDPSTLKAHTIYASLWIYMKNPVRLTVWTQMTVYDNMNRADMLFLGG